MYCISPSEIFLDDEMPTIFSLLSGKHTLPGSSSKFSYIHLSYSLFHGISRQTFGKVKLSYVVLYCRAGKYIVLFWFILQEALDLPPLITRRLNLMSSAMHIPIVSSSLLPSFKNLFHLQSTILLIMYSYTNHSVRYRIDPSIYTVILFYFRVNTWDSRIYTYHRKA